MYKRQPRDYPFEYESKAAGAASLDWSLMRKHLKVDAFCMETFRWYGAKVADVSQERRQVKVRAGRRAKTVAVEPLVVETFALLAQSQL